MSLRLIVIIVFVINLIQGISTPILDDEAYYWMWSQRLDFGYFDHPPMVALWIYFSDLLFNAEIGARFFTILLNTFAVVFLWKILNPSSKRDEIVFLLLYLSVPLVQIFSFVSTPDAPLLFFTIFYLYVLKNFLSKNTLKWAVLLGVAFAGIMYSKYHGVLVLGFTLLPIINKIYTKPYFYYAIIFSLLLYSPHLYWLYQHDFPPVKYHFIDRSAEEHFSILHVLVYLGTAVGVFGGFLIYYIYNAIKSFKLTDNFSKSVYWLVLGPFVFFLISTIKHATQAQWLLISYIGMMIILYRYIINQKNIKIFYILSGITASLIIIARVVLMIPIISPLYKTIFFGKEAGKLIHTDVVAFEKYQEASIFQFYNQEKRGVVYKTLGNRNSQFTMWDDEQLLQKPFQFISPWMESNLKFKGLKDKDYYITSIIDYTPIHQTEAVFLDTVDEIVVSKGNTYSIKFKLNKINIELLKSEKVKLGLFITQDKQYNIVDQIPVAINQPINFYETKDGYIYETVINNSLEPGEYAIYVGLTPSNLITKYQSLPLKLKVTE